jgi:hypothetical protein
MNLIVWVEGGIVQAVYSTAPKDIPEDLDIIVVDEDHDAEDLFHITRPCVDSLAEASDEVRALLADENLPDEDYT